ncbi:hypothetical protein CCUS01_16943, partial [Colletotrichum cuscutae]
FQSPLSSPPFHESNKQLIIRRKPPRQRARRAHRMPLTRQRATTPTALGQRDAALAFDVNGT